MAGDAPADKAAFCIKPPDIPKPPPKPEDKKVQKKTMGGYEDQVVRAGVCHLEVPKYCTLPEKALDVLTDLLLLFTFSLAQAWWCEILEKDRFENLKKSPWVFAVIFLTPIIISALGLIEGLKPWDVTNPGEDFEFSSIRTTIYIFGLVIVVFFIAWHFARAWLTLPGVQLISGGSAAKPPEKNLHGIYTASRVVIVVYAILFTSFLLVEDDGLNYRGALLAWTLSLIAVFPHNVSNLWLAITTGVFLQGIGSHRLAFLGCEN